MKVKKENQKPSSEEPAGVHHCCWLPLIRHPEQPGASEMPVKLFSSCSFARLTLIQAQRGRRCGGGAVPGIMVVVAAAAPAIAATVDSEPAESKKAIVTVGSSRSKRRAHSGGGKKRTYATAGPVPNELDLSH